MACRLRSEQEAKYYLKITLARRKTRTEAARPSFPGDTSSHGGDSGWPMRNSYPLHKDISLSLSFSPHFQSLLLSLPLPLLTFVAPPKHLPPHSTHTICPGLGWLMSRGKSSPSSDQKVTGSCSQSRAPNCALLCLSWESGYVSRIDGNLQSFWENPIHIQVRDLGGLVANRNVSALCAGNGLHLQLLHNAVQLTVRQPSRIKGPVAHTSGKATVNNSYWILKQQITTGQSGRGFNHRILKYCLHHLLNLQLKILPWLWRHYFLCLWMVFHLECTWTDYHTMQKVMLAYCSTYNMDRACRQKWLDRTHYSFVGEE